MPAFEAARELLAPRADVWAFLAEPYNLPDWWPGIGGLQPERAEVILAGACIVRSVMDLLGAPALTASDRGIRHGVFLDRFGE